jgi:hypothetical protein
MDAVIHAAFVVMRGDLGRKRYDRALVRITTSTAASTSLRGRGNAAFPGDPPLQRRGIWCLARSSRPHSRGAALPPIAGFAYGEDKAAVEVWRINRIGEQHA